MPLAVLEPTITLFERLKVVRTVDRAAIGAGLENSVIIIWRNCDWN